MKMNSSMRLIALEELFEHRTDILDDYLRDWQSGKITSQQYGARINEMIEERLAEMSQRQDEE